MTHQHGLRMADPTPLRILPADEFETTITEFTDWAIEEDTLKEKVMSLVTKYKAWPTVLQIGGLVVVVVAVVFAPAIVRSVAIFGAVVAGVGYAWRTIEKGR